MGPKPPHAQTAREVGSPKRVREPLSRGIAGATCQVSLGLGVFHFMRLLALPVKTPSRSAPTRSHHCNSGTFGETLPFSVAPVGWIWGLAIVRFAVSKWSVPIHTQICGKIVIHFWNLDEVSQNQNSPLGVIRLWRFRVIWPWPFEREDRHGGWPFQAPHAAK